jgi:superfamily II DNA helicase RecQ
LALKFTYSPSLNSSTFTRPYLVFDVVAKSLANFKKVMEGLRSIHPRGSGIIFCMSK